MTCFQQTYLFISVKLCYCWNFFFKDLTKEIGTNYVLPNGLLETKCVKIQLYS